MLKEQVENALLAGLCTHKEIGAYVGCAASYSREVVMEDDKLFTMMLKNKAAKKRERCMQLIRKVKPLRDDGMKWREIVKRTGINNCSYRTACLFVGVDL